jgi:GAF domain-containing protein
MGNTNIYKKKFSILQDLSSAVLIDDNINVIADILLEAAINYANAEKGSIMLLNDREELSILAHKGLDPQFIGSYKATIGQGIAGIVAKNSQPVLVVDIDNETSFKKLRRDHYKTKSFIACPIISRNKLLGVLNINDKKDGSPFNEDEFELTRTIANQAAISLEKASLMTQLKSKAAELEEINKKLVETDILKTEFITRVSHELRTPLNTLKGAIYFLQHTEAVGKNEQDEFHGIISTEINKLVTIVENLLNFLRLEDETRIIKKTVLTMGDIFRELQDSKSLMAALSRKGVTLDINTQDNRLDFVGDKIKVIQLFTNLLDGLGHYLERGDSMKVAASETSYVMVNIVLPRPLPDYAMSILSDSKYVFEAEHPEDRLKLYLARNIVETHRWKLAAVNSATDCQVTLSIPRSVKQTIDTYVGQSMDSFVQFISELLDIDICSIMLSDELTSELTVKSAIGLDDDIIKRTRIKFGDKIAGWVALEGKPLFIENIEKDERFSKVSISQYTTKSLLSLPLKIGDRVVGVLNLNNKKTSEPFSKRDYTIASHLSEKISEFIALLYSDNYSEDKLRTLVGSFDNLLTGDKTTKPRKDMVPALTSEILKNSRSLKKIKHKPDAT